MIWYHPTCTLLGAAINEDPWCSGLPCLPVTQKIAGSNPVGSGRFRDLPKTREASWADLFLLPCSQGRGLCCENSRGQSILLLTPQSFLVLLVEERMSQEASTPSLSHEIVRDASFVAGSRIIFIPYFGRKVTRGKGTTRKPGTSSGVHCCKIAASSRRVSISAKGMPMQMRGPMPKGKNAPCGIFCASSGCQRSGRNTSGSPQMSGRL